MRILIFFLSIALAGDLASRVQEAYRQTDALRADFVQKTFVQLLEKEVEEHGTLLLAKPNRFVIHYQGPHERRYISDGKRLWILRPQEQEEVAFREAVGREALAFLSGLGEMDKEFQVTEQATGGEARLSLVPRAPTSPFKKIVLQIDPATQLAREVFLFPKSGNRTHYIFSRLRKEDHVSDSFHP